MLHNLQRSDLHVECDRALGCSSLENLPRSAEIKTEEKTQQWHLVAASMVMNIDDLFFLKNSGQGNATPTFFFF